MKQVYLPDGSSMPQLGQGTWQMGEDDNKYERGDRRTAPRHRAGHDSDRHGRNVCRWQGGEYCRNAAKPFARESLYICDKVYPKNADRKHIYSSVERSLKLLGTDYIDLYLLHWREDADLAEVAYCMEDLKDRGWIRRWGVSNFDVDDMEDLWKVPDGNKCTVNQVLYNLGTRGIEYDLLDWQREKGVPFMAYSPVGQAGALTTQDGVSKSVLMSDPHVKAVADRHGISIVQLLLAFVLRYDDMVAIPKAVSFDHVEENAQAADIHLTEEDLEELSVSFPAPTEKIPMEKY